MMGQIVPTVKDYMSPDFSRGISYNRRMIEWLGPEEFNDKLCARVKRLREERGWNQAQMAAAIGVQFETYKKYETRTPLPHYLIPRFALQVDREVAYVLTGKNADVQRRGPRVLTRTATNE